MDCEQVRELEGAFALDALDAEDRAAVVAHVDACDEHGNLAELRAAGMLLGATAEEQMPPERLRARILASAAGRPERRRGGPVWGTKWWYAAAASLLLVVLAVTTAVLLRQQGGASDVYVKEFVAADVAVHFEAKFEDPYTRATFAGLAPKEDYQLWVIRGDDWLSVGSFKANAEGNWAGDFTFETKPGDSICLTLRNPAQPSGPFGQPVFVEPVS